MDNPGCRVKFFTICLAVNKVKQNFKKNAWDGDGFSSLDPRTKYCLVDTMVVLPMQQGDPDVTRDAKQELHGATLILLNKIVSEAAHKHDELEGGNEKTGFVDFVSSLSSQLGSAGIRFKFVHFERGMSASVKKMINNKIHPNLSPVDYALLFAAMMRQDMDVMTDDKGLIGSINKERSPKTKGKIRSVMPNYRKRRWDTARLIRNKLDKYVPENVYVKWRDRPRYTEFLIEDVKVASIDHSRKGSVQVDLSSWAKNRNEVLKLQPELETQIWEYFSKWKPKRGGKGPAQGKDWYMRRRGGNDDIDGLSEARKRRLSRELQKRNINLDI